MSRIQEPDMQMETPLEKKRRLPHLLVCSFCGKLQDEQGRWFIYPRLEKALKHFPHTHAICPECLEKNFQDLLDDKAS